MHIFFQISIATTFVIIKVFNDMPSIVARLLIRPIFFGIQPRREYNALFVISSCFYNPNIVSLSMLQLFGQSSLFTVSFKIRETQVAAVADQHVSCPQQLLEVTAAMLNQHRVGHG